MKRVAVVIAAVMMVALVGPGVERQASSGHDVVEFEHDVRGGQDRSLTRRTRSATCPAAACPGRSSAAGAI